MRKMLPLNTGGTENSGPVAASHRILVRADGMRRAFSRYSILVFRGVLGASSELRGFT